MSAESIINESKKDADNLAQIVSSAKIILEETQKQIDSIQIKKDEISELTDDINAQYEINKKKISSVSREMCELLITFTESAITHAEKEKNLNLKNGSLLKLYRLSYKYPDTLDERTRESYILNLSVFGDKSDIEPLRAITKSENEYEKIKSAAATVLGVLEEKYP